VRYGLTAEECVAPGLPEGSWVETRGENLSGYSDEPDLSAHEPVKLTLYVGAPDEFHARFNADQALLPAAIAFLRYENRAGVQFKPSTTPADTPGHWLVEATVNPTAQPSRGTDHAY
jgi:hypothetical protein